MAVSSGTLVLATRSSHKAREIQAVLGPIYPAPITTLAALGIAATPAEEDIEAFSSFRENALAKARYFQSALAQPVLADDSGLVVDALHGAPGIFSRRFSGRSDLDGQALDDANNRTLLDRLRPVPPEDRTAHYVCAAVLLLPEAAPLVAIGACTGLIVESPRGTGGFGYDPLFFDPQEGCTFGQLPAWRKNQKSHRSRAFRALAAALHHTANGHLTPP